MVKREKCHARCSPHPRSAAHVTPELTNAGELRDGHASCPYGATALTAPAANGTYYLRIAAVNACGASATAPEATVTIGGPGPSVPGAPRDLTQHVAGRAATLSWLSPSTGGEATRYVIEATDSQGNVVVRHDTGNASTTFAHGDVPPGHYIVSVRAVNAGGAGASSNSVTVVVSP